MSKLYLVLLGIILIAGCVNEPETPGPELNVTQGPDVVMFHNGRGPMCLEAVDFFESINYPVEQHLDTEPGFRELITGYINQHEKSEGVSDSFGYYPMIFVNDKAYSGFNEEVKNSILAEIQAE